MTGQWKTRCVLILVAMVGAHIAANHSWMHRNGFFNRPPPIDAASHRLRSQTIRGALRSGGLSAMAVAVIKSKDHHPPLMSATTAILCAVTGNEETPRMLWATTIVFWIILVFSSYSLARNFCSPPFALLSSVISICSLSLITEARPYYVQLPMAACCVAALDALVRSRLFTSRRMTLAFGIWSGLALSSKIIAPVYLGGSTLVACWFSARLHGVKFFASNLVLAALPCLLIAAPWYALNLSDVVGYTSDHVGPEGYEVWGKGFGYFSAERWLFYVRGFVNSGIGLPMTGIVIMLMMKRVIIREKGTSNLLRENGLVLSLGSLFTFVAITLGHCGVAGHYLVSLVPLAAIFVAFECARIRPVGLRVLVVGAVIASSAFTLHLGFRDFDKDDVSHSAWGFHLIGRTDNVYVDGFRSIAAHRQPEAENWALDEVARLMVQRESMAGYAVAYIPPPVDPIALSTFNLDYEIRRHGGVTDGNAFIELTPASLRDVEMWQSKLRRFPFLVVIGREVPPALVTWIELFVNRIGFEAEVLLRAKVSARLEYLVLYARQA